MDIHYKDFMYIQNRLINRIDSMCIFNNEYESECYKTSAHDCIHCDGFPKEQYKMENSQYNHSR